MRPIDCEFEAEVLSAVLESRWPDHTASELRAHASACAVCRDVVAVASAFDGAREELLAGASLPDSGRVWHQARLRARREAIQAAGRPITAVQVIAVACAVGLAGACFGATSTWFQSLLGWVAASWKGIDKAAWLASAASLVAEHGALAALMLAIVFVIPTAVFVALGRD